MKIFSWNPEKNRQLQQERGISFEEIVFYIENGGLLDVLEHPNQTIKDRDSMWLLSMNMLTLSPWWTVKKESF